ncbi:MAG: Squalene-phytoene synthase [Rhodospirillaceae bacterium]|nr:MAG: Squalene-phytoene synthase [Rhodospirillaceae bacterium]
MLTELAVVSCCIWGGLLLFRRRFWQAEERLQIEDAVGTPHGGEWPEVVVVIPARDEAEVIGISLPTVLRQDYPGRLRVIVVDDNSRDGTGEAARAAAAGTMTPLEVTSGTALPAGWTGKVWAMAKGLGRADVLAPEARYVLLTDADIAYDPWVVRALVRKAEGEGRHLVSVMALLRCESRWERLLIPAFVFFFQKLYPFAAVNDPRHPAAAAAGGCLLVRRDSLKAVGDFALIRNRLIDDCALARLMKAQGSIWLGLSGAVRSLRAYDSRAALWSMVTRTAFVQLDHRVGQLVGTVLAMILVYLAGPVAVGVGSFTGAWGMAGIGALTWGMMAFVYRPTLAVYRRRWGEGLALPVAAFFYTLMTIDSAFQFWAGRGGAWKGRIQQRPLRLRNDAMRAVAARAQTSFFWAMALLGREKRAAMFAIYAFCRTVDDIADDIADPAERAAGLAWWREEVTRLYEGCSPRHPVAAALATAAGRFGLRRDDCLAVIDGMVMDAQGPVYAPTLAELDLYCDRVASAVGRLSVRVFGLPAAEGESLSHALGRALQVTNILRDIAEDAGRGRLYLPREFLAAHGVAVEAPVAEILRHPALPRVCADLAHLARHHFAEAERILAVCPRGRARPAALMKAVYQRYLRRLEAGGFRVLGPRVRLSGGEKLALVLRHMV